MRERCSDGKWSRTVGGMSSTQRQARIAGLLYLLLTAGGIFSVLYVPSALVARGDAAATAARIASSELLFRAGTAASLCTSAVFVLLALALYRLFEGVDRWQATEMVALVVVSAASGFVVALDQLAALVLLSEADFLSVFERPQLEALAYACLRFQSRGLEASQLFWGLWLFPFGRLVYRCGFIPRALGILLLMAGSGYLLDFAIALLAPYYDGILSQAAGILVLGELPIVLWLLIVGARPRPSTVASD